MPVSIFDEYDQCETCQSLTLKPSNIETVRAHIIGQHRQPDIALFVCSRMSVFRCVFEEIYTMTKPYHEPGFDADLRLAFYAKSWEMLTCRGLLQPGLNVHPNISQAGPDFTTDTAYIECIAVEPDKEYVSTLSKPGEEMVFQEVPESEIQLRITNGFHKKSLAIKRYLDLGIIDPSKPRIIAINTSRAHDFSFADSDELVESLVLKSLFAMGPEQITFRGDGEPGKTSIKFQPQIQKKGTTLIPADYFLTDEHKHISAVIFSRYQIQSSESSHISIVNNPFAEIPINLDDYKDFNRIYADKDASTLTKTMRDRPLYS